MEGKLFVVKKENSCIRTVARGFCIQEIKGNFEAVEIGKEKRINVVIERYGYPQKIFSIGMNDCIWDLKVRTFGEEMTGNHQFFVISSVRHVYERKVPGRELYGGLRIGDLWKDEKKMEFHVYTSQQYKHHPFSRKTNFSQFNFIPKVKFQKKLVNWYPFCEIHCERKLSQWTPLQMTIPKNAFDFSGSSDYVVEIRIYEMNNLPGNYWLHPELTMKDKIEIHRTMMEQRRMSTGMECTWSDLGEEPPPKIEKSDTEIEEIIRKQDVYQNPIKKRIREIGKNQHKVMVVACTELRKQGDEDKVVKLLPEDGFVVGRSYLCSIGIHKQWDENRRSPRIDFFRFVFEAEI